MFDWLTSAARVVAAVSTFGQSELAGQVYGAFTQAPDTVNYRGDKKTEGMQNYLNGVKDPAQAAAMFNNWLTGGKPAPIDPSVSLAHSAAFAGVYAKGSAGMGMGGLFGLGKILGSGFTAPSPQAGVPYSVPPIPTLFKPGGR